MMQERLDDMLAMTEPVHPTKVTFPEFLEIFVEAQREDDPHKVPRFDSRVLLFHVSDTSCNTHHTPSQHARAGGAIFEACAELLVHGRRLAASRRNAAHGPAYVLRPLSSHFCCNRHASHSPRFCFSFLFSLSDLRPNCSSFPFAELTPLQDFLAGTRPHPPPAKSCGPYFAN
jgi:hypothetical protein